MAKIDLTALRDAIKAGKLERVKSMLPPVIAMPEPVLGTAAVEASFEPSSGLVEVNYEITVTDPDHYLAIQTVRIVTATDDLVGGTGGYFGEGNIHNTEYVGTVGAMASQLSGETLAVTVWGWLADESGVVAVLQAETSVDIP